MSLAGKSDEYIAEDFRYLHQRNGNNMIQNGAAPKVDANELYAGISE